MYQGTVFASEWNRYEIIEYTLMQNWRGDRYARIVVHNPSWLDDIIQDRHFIATLADQEGTKVEGMGLQNSIRISGKETKTITIYFGRQYWPIVNIDLK